MTRSIEFEVSSTPVTWKRARRSGRQSYTDPTMAAAQAEIAWHFSAAARSWPLDKTDRFTVAIDVFTKTRTRSDLDNFAKLVLDALEGHAWTNDAQVDELTVRRHHRPTQPGWLIAITTKENP